jgi:hypothetical protein
MQVYVDDALGLGRLQPEKPRESKGNTLNQLGTGIKILRFQ